MGGVIRLELLGGVVVSKDIGSGVGSHIESEETPHPDYWGEGKGIGIGIGSHH